METIISELLAQAEYLDLKAVPHSKVLARREMNAS